MSSKNLYCYLRVSTQTQVDEGHSIENQRFLGKRVSKRLGLKYVELNEGGMSSTNPNRPQFQKIKHLIDEGKCKNLWYLNRSRWTRNQLEDLLVKRDFLRPNNVNVYEGESGSQRNFTDPSEEMLDNILSSVQEYDKNQRRHISMSGKRHLSLTKGETGVFMGGTITFGYKNVDKRYQINPEESKWVKEVFKRYVNGESLKDIKGHLDTQGVKPRRSKFWSLGSLNVMLRSRIYIGEYIWEDKDTKEKFRITVPPIISHSLFNRVQKQIDKNMKNKGNNSRKYESLLSDLLTCYCGMNISGQVRKTTGKNYYTCSSKRMKWIGKDVPECQNRRGMNLDYTDEYVVGEIQKVLSDSSILKERFKKDVMSKKDLEGKELDQQKKDLEKKIKNIDKQIGDLVKNLSGLEVNRITKKIDDRLYKQLKKDFDSTIGDLDEEKVNIIGEINDIDTRNDWLDWVGKYGKEIKTQFKGVSSDLLEGLISSIKVTPSFGKNRDEKTLQVGHILDINFKLPIVKDSIEWIDDKKKSKGYNVINGKKKLRLTTSMSKGGRGKKKQIQL